LHFYVYSIGLKWRPTVLVQYSENKQYTLRLGIMTDQETQVTLRWSLTTDSGFNISPRTRVFEEGTYYTVEVASLSSIVKFEQFLGTLQVRLSPNPSFPPNTNDSLFFPHCSVYDVAFVFGNINRFSSYNNDV